MMPVTRLIAGLAATAAVLGLSSSPALASFGVEEFKAEAINQNGSLDTQAGGHPYEAIAAFKFSQSANSEYPDDQAGNVKDIEVELPPGFVGNPQATPQCTENELALQQCPADTQVGVVTITFGGHLAGPDTQPVYNLVPQPGHPAAFGLRAAPTGIVAAQVVASVNPVTGYRLVTTAADIATGTGSQGLLPIVAVKFVFWGIPADPAHNAGRNEVCNEEATVGANCIDKEVPSEAPITPFLTNPTSCQSGPLTTTLRVDSWQNPGHYLTYTMQSPQPTGCEKLTFHPSLAAEPETTQADSPTGETFRVKVPQGPNTYGLGTPELNNATVTLPQGLTIDPSAANGLAGCTNEQIAVGSEDPVTCPAASKLGTVEVFTPLLANGPNGEAPLNGAIYLGTPVPGQEYRIFLAIEGHGVSIRLEGKISANPTTGQLTATFTENPPLPFNELVLRFFGGSTAALANPLTCGSATTTSDLTPYGAPEVPDATPASTFGVTDCGDPPTFTPTLTAGTAPSTAGTYSTFSLQLARGDGQQYISQIPSVTLPPGLLGNISTVPLCASPQAAAGTCGPLSQIGSVTVGAGPGSTPFYLPGEVYLTEGYGGDPFGLSIVVPAIAGPYNLGTVVVRAGIAVNPQTAAITVQAEPLPTILEGIPLRLRYIGITIDRPNFLLNPTNCAQKSIAATIDAEQGATASPSSPFFATGCASLPFAPVLVASTPGSASGRGNGAGLTVRVAQAPGEADIRSVRVELPKLLPARQSTLNNACPEATFAADPASCPAGAVIGSAIAHTPLLPVPVQGPVYFVSHAGRAFPELVTVLQGDGVTIHLASETFIDSKTGITSSTFAAVPDAPISSFELRLPEQSNSALGSPEGDLCGRALTMPTTVQGANGAVVKQSTSIAVTGCRAADPLTRAQKLQRALKACTAQHKRSKRAACDASARKRYGPTTKTSQANRRADR